ncbi:MAG: hypothetical protein ACD_46C00518G0003 [uncultured bacterium]|nr:MAG: hypothetical protein ACD_46C00518G0003 [uncultured bacterium]
MPIIQFPQALLKYTQNKSSVEISCHSFFEISNYLKTSYPELYQLLFNQHGTLHSFVVISVNAKLIRATDQLTLTDQDVIGIMLPLAGG